MDESATLEATSAIAASDTVKAIPLVTFVEAASGTAVTELATEYP